MNNPFEPINARLNNLEALTLEVLQYLRSNDSTPPPADDFLSLKAASLFMGIADQTLYQNVKRIPHSKRFGKLFFRRSDLVAYLEEGRAVRRAVSQKNRA